MDIKIIIAIVYILAMIFVGIINSKKIKSYSDFSIASKTIPFWRNTHSISAAAIGAGSTMGIAGLVYVFGISGSWIGFAGALGLLVSAFLFASRLWKSNAVTFPEIINNRFGATIGNISAALVIFAYIAVAASQVLALGVVIQLLTGLTLTWSILLGVAVIVIYTVLGGMFSTAMTDSVNMAIMAISVMFVLPLVAILKSGGFGKIQLPTAHLEPFTMGFGTILGLVVWVFFVVLMDQGNFLRMFGAKTAKQAKGASIVASLAVITPYNISVLAVGLLGVALVPGIQNPDAVLPTLIVEVLGSIVGGIVLAGVLAAVLSTAGSMMIVTSNNISNDIVRRIKPDMADKTLIAWSRISVVIVAAVSLVFALFADSIISLMQDLSSPYVCALMPVLIAAFYSKRATKSAAMATIIVGAGSSIIWWIIGKPFGIHHVIPGVILASLTMLIAIAMTKKPAANN